MSLLFYGSKNNAKTNIIFIHFYSLTLFSCESKTKIRIVAMKQHFSKHVS